MLFPFNNNCLFNWVYLFNWACHWFIRPSLGRTLTFMLMLVSVSPQLLTEVLAEEAPVRLLDREPFDRLTIEDGTKIDVSLLDLPGREVPEDYPTSGQIEVRRLSEPSVPYTVAWSSLAKIELFEQLLLEEGKQLTAAGNSTEAYAYLDFLHVNYPRLPGLREAMERYLFRDAAAAYKGGQFDEALSILLSLYDRNPQYSGLGKVVQSVGDQLISKHLAANDFSSARSVLDLLIQGFPQLQVASVSSWQQKFNSDAARQLTLSRQAIDQGNFLKARQAVRRAQGILPKVSGANALLQEINRLSPQVMVGVSQHGTKAYSSSLSDWSTARVRRLLFPQLVELADFGAEGGIYDCQWGELSSDDSGLNLEVRLYGESLAEGITPELITLQLLRMADPSSASYQVGMRGVLENVNIGRGQEVLVRWQVSHVRPEALLQMDMNQVTRREPLPGTYQAMADAEQPEVVRYRLAQRTGTAQGPQSIIERAFIDDQAALAALLRNDIDLLDRIPPWQVEPLRERKDILVDFYRIPTVHVLIPNHAKPLLGRREFRRALCYGIDRQRILGDILLGGRPQPGFRVLSGPLPSGARLGDPVGYAYDSSILPRPYEPRLAAVLSQVARNSLAQKKAIQAGKKPSEIKEAKPPPAEPLILVYPPEPLARTACQTIKLQLDAVGIPIQLRELTARQEKLPEDYDLFYTDLNLWEPLVDARRLLGPQGRAGSCSPAMSLALRHVDKSENWKQARTRLRQVHQIAASDLPVIPLWQTVNAFAYRRELTGVGSSPVSLYQNVSDWKINIPGAGQ